MTGVVCIGECMVELSPAGPDLLGRRFAGDAYNTAVYLKRARPQVEVRFLTATGADPLSQAMREAWRAEGVLDDLAFVDPLRRPALYLIETDSAGDRRFHYWRSESAARGWFDALQANGGASLLQGSDLVYVSGISLAILASDRREAAIAFLRELGRTTQIAFDPNLRPVLWPSIEAARACVEAVASIAHIVLPSRQDMATLFGEEDTWRQVALLAELGAREVALTAEGDEAVVYDGGLRTLAPPKAQVIDTSGGGDSFNGAYLAARLTGADPLQAAAEGLALAARVVEQRGALIPA